jgi:DNA polymerase III delta prime subunit
MSPATTSTKVCTTPWCEKYRPTHFSQIVLEPYNRKIFENIIETQRFPHLLFYGPPGVGKTTSAENLIRAYQKKQYQTTNYENVIHLNASDERGIEVIRNQIYQFVKSQNMFETGYKFVVLDEVDYMTKNAQQALKNLMQTYNENVRFCLICNYICKIEESLKNEFICIRFNQLPTQEIVEFMKNIRVQEKLSISDELIRKIQNMYHSDIRSMVNFLQLHQEDSVWDQHLFHDDFFEDFHKIIQTLDRDAITQWIHQASQQTYNMDTHTCLNKYFNYMIRHQHSYINIHFLNMAETIIHHTNNPTYMIPYFVEYILEHYQTIQENQTIQEKPVKKLNKNPACVQRKRIKKLKTNI